MADPSALPVDTPNPTSLILLLAPPFLGALIAWLLGGVSVVQLYLYIRSFPNDRAAIRFIVYLVFALDVFHSILCAVLVWHELVGGWGRESQLLSPDWSFITVPAADGVIALVVQVFYAWRIWVLKKWIIVPGLIVAVAVVSFAFSWVITFQAIGIQTVAGLHPLFPKTCVWLGGSSAADILIAVCMVYILTRAKANSSALRKSTQTIDRLIALSVEAGTLTAACAITELTLFLASPNTTLHVLFALTLGKLYANSLFASLNARILSRGPHDTFGAVTTNPSGTASGSSAPTKVSALNFGSGAGPRKFGGGVQTVSVGATSYAPTVHVEHERFDETSVHSTQAKNDIEMLRFEDEARRVQFPS